jgi:hypothetical protein
MVKKFTQGRNTRRVIMPEVVPLEGIERHLKIARDLADTAGETKLSYFIDLAILETKAVGMERKANEEEAASLKHQWAH